MFSMIMVRQEVNIDELKDLLVLAVKAFYEQDGHLVKDDLCERALTFRIGLQLQKLLRNIMIFMVISKANSTRRIQMAW